MCMLPEVNLEFDMWSAAENPGFGHWVAYRIPVLHAFFIIKRRPGSATSPTASPMEATPTGIWMGGSSGGAAVLPLQDNLLGRLET